MKVVTINDGSILYSAEVIKHTLSSGVVIPVVGVGESGRGRKYSYLVTELLKDSKQQWEQEDKTLITSASVGKTKSGNPKLLQAEETEEKTKNWLVVFRTPIGFRGSNSHAGDVNDKSWTEEEKEKYDQPKSQHCLDFPGTILTTGIIAEGDAGRMGSGEQLICTVPVGSIVRVGYGGRRYSSPTAHYYQFNEKNVVVATWDERLASDIF